MAPGKLDGYRVNEFRDRESDLYVSKRDYYYSRNENYRHRSRGRDLGSERRKEQGGRDSYKPRHKDSRKREEIDEWCYSSLSAGKSGGGASSGGNGYNNITSERELGEISSGSGSDGSIASASQANGRDVEDGFPPRKKPKFSPIVWDKEEKDVNGNSKNGVIPIVSSLSAPKDAPIDGVQVSSMSVGPIRLHEHSPNVDLCGSLGFSFVNGDRKGAQAEEQDSVPKQNIPTSRWADEDEGEILEDEEMHRRGKNIPASGSSATSLSSKLLSPEFGGFTSAHARESESPLKLYKNDDVDVNEDDENNKIAFYGSDTDLEEENDYLGTPEPTVSQQRSINMLHSCRSVHEFERLNKIGAGTYGVVYQSRDKRNGEIVALKKVKMDNEREGFPLTSLREINILLSLRHPSVVEVKEVVVEEDEKRGKCEVYLVMEYMEHDLKGLMEVMKQPFSQSEVKCLMLQLLEGVKYLHDNWVLHRDLKTSNILLNNCGELKICDFGLSRQYGSALKPYTPLVVTLQYRAPELLLGAKQYSTAIDMWSLGCIMAELLAKKPLFFGKSEIDQLDKIFKTLGTPSEMSWPGFSKLPGVKINFVKQKYNLLREKFPPTSFTGSPFLSAAGLDLLNRLLTYDPEKRITAQDAVNHEWFREFPPPKDKEFMPTFPAQHAKARNDQAAT